MSEKVHTKISQYKRVLKKMSDVPSIKGETAGALLSSMGSALLQLNIVINNCQDFGIPVESLFDIRGENREEFLNQYGEDLKDEGVDRSTGLEDLLDKVCRYVRSTMFRGEEVSINGQLVVDAHVLFNRRFDIFMSEIENATILEEIKLEKMNYITLAGLLLTALLTVANIIVTSIKDQKNE
jgi:hypothetical protein